MTFLDTSAIYAMTDRSDPNHAIAKEQFQMLLQAGEPILIHNYILVEAMALIQHRLGLGVALKLAREAVAFEMQWIDSSTHNEAVLRMERQGKRQVSLVDQVSFLVMRQHGVQTALAFDSDFEREGFSLSL